MDKIKNIVAYKKLLRTKGMSFNSDAPPAFIPNPTEMDYKKGYVDRFFIQKINDTNASITEINASEVKDVLSNGYHNFVKVMWKISGKEEEIKMINKKSIKLVYKEMPKLLFYLPNLLQFAKLN